MNGLLHFNDAGKGLFLSSESFFASPFFTYIQAKQENPFKDLSYFFFLFRAWSPTHPILCKILFSIMMCYQDRQFYRKIHIDNKLSHLLKLIRIVEMCLGKFILNLDCSEWAFWIRNFYENLSQCGGKRRVRERVDQLVAQH